MVWKVDAPDVGEAIRGLKRADVDETVTDSFREQTPALVNEARGRMASRAGGGTYPRRSGMITSDRAGMKLNAGRFPWAAGAEFGSLTSMVFGRRVSNASMSRPHFAPWTSGTFTLRGKVGYLVGETLRKNAEDMAETAVEDVHDEIVSELKRSGVRVRG